MSARLAAGWALSRSHGRVGGADDPVPAPRDHEQHRRLGADDEPRLGPDPVARDDEVDALGRLDVQRAPAADHLLDLVGPDAGRVDDDPGADLELAAVLQVEGAYADHPLALAEEAGHLDPRRDLRAVRGGGAGDRQHQPRVVDLRVVVADRAVVGLRARSPARSGPRPCGTGAGAAAARPRPGRTAPSRRRAAARTRRRVAPSRGGSAGRGTAPAGPGGAPAG